METNLHPVEKRIITQNYNSSKAFVQTLCKQLKAHGIRVTSNMDFTTLGLYSPEGASGLNSRLKFARDSWSRARESGLATMSIDEFIQSV